MIITFSKRSFATLVLATTLAVGCDDENDSSVDGGGDASISEAGVAGTGGLGGTAAGGKSADTKFGSVSVDQALSSNSYRASAAFGSSQGLQGSPGLTCTSKTEGACVISVCTAVDGGVAPDADATPDAGAVVAPQVGRIDITGGVEPVAIVPDATGQYAAVSGTKVLWTGATKLTFKAVGGTIAAFPQTELEAPLGITAIKVNGAAPPAFPAKATVAKAGPLSFMWTGGSAQVSLSVVQSLGGRTVAGVCTVAASAATLAVPATLLKELSPGDAITLVGQSVSKTVMAGAYATTLSALTSPDNSLILMTVQ